MKRTIILTSILLMGCLVYGRIVTEIEKKPLVDVNAIEQKVTYEYKVPMPDGSSKLLAFSHQLSAVELKKYAETIIQAQIDKQKEIEQKVEALTYKGTVIQTKQWILYKKVISYDYRYKLPDGSTNWLNSRVPLKEEEVLAKIKQVYRGNLMEENSE